MGAQAVVSLTVDETGGLAGFRRFQSAGYTAFQTTRAEVAKFTEQTTRAAAEVEKLGNAGKKAGQAMADGHAKANSHALTDLDTVRLLRDDLGVRIPRAMEKLIASTEAFHAVAQAAFGVFAFVGVVELLSTIGSKISEWGHNLAGDTKAVQDFHKALVEANDARLVNPGTDDQAVKNRTALMAEIKMLEDRRDKGAMNKVLTAALLNPDNLSSKEKSDTEYYSSADDNQLQKAKAQLGELDENNARKDQQRNAERAKEARENTEITLDGMRKIAQARVNERAEVDDKVNGTNGQEKSLTKEEGEKQKALIDQKYGAQNVVLQRQYAEEVRNAWQAAFVSRLQGEQRAYQQTLYEVQDFEAKAKRDGRMDTASGKRDVLGEEQAMWEKYLNEKAQRQQQFARETMNLAQQVRAVQSEGTARTLVEETSAIEQLAQERIDSGRQAEEFDQQYADRKVQIEARANAEITKSLKDYADSERRMYDDLAVSASKGYAKIAAEQKRRADAADKEYHQKVDGMDMWDPRRADAHATYALKLGDIQADSDKQRADLHQRNLDTTQDMEDQAQSVRRGSHGRGLDGMLSAEQDATAKITAEYEKRVRAAKEAFSENELSITEYQQRVQAINDDANAQMAAAQESMREKLTGEIEGAFKNPMAAIRKEMEHEMAAMIADWVMQLGAFKRIFGSTFDGTIIGKGDKQTATPQTHVGGLIGKLMGQGKASSGAPDSTASPSDILPSSAPSTYSPGGYGLGGAVSAPSSYDGIAAARESMSSSVSSQGMSPSGMVSDLGSLTATSTRAYDALNPPAVPAVSGGVAQDNAGYVDAGNDPDQMPTYSAQDTSLLQPGASGASTAMGLAGQGMAAYAGFTGVVNAFEGGKGSDVLSGAMSGAELGGAVGTLAGPLGTAIGAGVGAAVGATAGLVGWASGEGNRLGAADYYKNTMRPQFEKSEKDYFDGTGGDIETAIGNVTSIGATGFQTMISKFGGTAATWAKSQYIDKEQEFIVRQMDQVAGGGHDYTRASAVQFHTGGLISDFGDLSTSANEGFIHAMLGEAVINPIAAGTHSSAISAMNAGASPSDIAGMYLRSGSAGSMTAPTSSGGPKHTWNVQTMDAHSFRKFLDERGGLDAIVESTTKRNSRYNGDSD